MKSEWIVTYEDSKIRVVNTWFSGEMLFVNDKLQDEKYSLFSADLTGHVINNNGVRKEIKVNLGGVFAIDCRVFVDDHKMTPIKVK